MLGNYLKRVDIFFLNVKKSFFPKNLFFVGNHLKHVEIQTKTSKSCVKKKLKVKTCRKAAILDFGPSPKSIGVC